MEKNETVISIATYSGTLKIGARKGKKSASAGIRKFNQEDVFFPTLKKVLSSVNSSMKEIGTVCAVSGPGRFTGLRIGLTFAGIMRDIFGARAYSCDLFEILAAKAAREIAGRKKNSVPERIAVVLHAFKDEYFLKFFSLSGKPESGAEWLGMKDAFSRIGERDYFITDAEEKKEIWSARTAGERAPLRICAVSPGDIMETALRKRNGKLLPLYIKPARYELL